MALRFRANQNGGAAMSWEGYSWLLLRACGVNSSQLMTLLQPFNNVGGIIVVTGEHGEFITTQAGNNVSGPKRFCQHSRGGADKVVAGTVTAIVVHSLEAIQIDKQQGP